MQKSAEVMRIMNNLIKLPEIAATMQSLSREMVKAGVLEDLVDDVMDQARASPARSPAPGGRASVRTPTAA